MSGLMRTALTEISMPGMDLVCNKKISLSSFCRRRAILFCLVVSIRFELGTRVRHQLRIIPELKFFVDDSLDYLERIDELLK